MENQAVKLKRPTFLTVICILSFVGLGWGIINNFISIIFGTAFSPFYTYIQSQAQMGLNEASASDPAAAFFIENIVEVAFRLIDKLPIFGSINLVLSGIALAGVIMMWNLRKIGFYLFAGARIIMIFVPFMLLGMNILTGMMGVSIFIGAGLFITFYAINFKHLEN